MIKSTFGITQEPFKRKEPKLLPQQAKIIDILKIHSQHGGFSVITGQPGVGKTVLHEHIEALAKEKEIEVASLSRTMHTYQKILRQLAESFKIETTDKNLEKELIQAAYNHVRERKTLFTIIDEAHLLDMASLRKLRLLFDKFPKNNNLVLFGQRDLLYYLSMQVNADIKSRITFSHNLLPLNDQDIEQFIVSELESVRLGLNVFSDGAMDLIIRSTQGNLRLCCNLCYGSLIEACRDQKRSVSITHVNSILVQPHWRSHEELVTQQTEQ